MIEIDLPPELEELFEKLAEKRGHTKNSCARKFIIELIEDMEDTDIALEVMKNSTGKFLTMEEVEADLGLEDVLWALAAEEAEKEGFLGIEESERFLKEIRTLT